jgi:hypothetical protein
MWGKVACVFGVHHWSEWKPIDPESPSKQIRRCARCPREKFNDAPVPGRTGERAYLKATYSSRPALFTLPGVVTRRVALRGRCRVR